MLHVTHLYHHITQVQQSNATRPATQIEDLGCHPYLQTVRRRKEPQKYMCQEPSGFCFASHGNIQRGQPEIQSVQSHAAVVTLLHAKLRSLSFAVSLACLNNPCPQSLNVLLCTKRGTHRAGCCREFGMSLGIFMNSSWLFAKKIQKVAAALPSFSLLISSSVFQVSIHQPSTVSMASFEHIGSRGCALLSTVTGKIKCTVACGTDQRQRGLCSYDCAAHS